MIETHKFGDFVPKNIKYLIIGSFAANSVNSDPSYDFFYSSKRNQFWPIIEEVYGVRLKTRADKIKLFIKLRIGITDIIYQCERKDGNSLDNNLVNIVYNPNLKSIVKDNNLEKILFTSRFVENLFRKIFKNLVVEFPSIELVTLPSPSPRYAKLTKAMKIEKYRELLPA